MKPKHIQALKHFLVELLVYTVLVAGYYLLVLHLMGNWLEGLFQHRRALYAGVALGLILGQGVFLESLTRLLLGWVKPAQEVE